MLYIAIHLKPSSQSTGGLRTPAPEEVDEHVAQRFHVIAPTLLCPPGDDKSGKQWRAAMTGVTRTFSQIISSSPSPTSLSFLRLPLPSPPPSYLSPFLSFPSYFLQVHFHSKHTSTKMSIDAHITSSTR